MIKIQGNQYPSDFEAKKAMVETGRQMAAKGYGIGTDGSMSVRVGPNAVWVTADEAQKGNLTQDMIVKVDLDGKPMLGARGRTLPEEMRIHLKLYREHPQIRAVVHGYPPAAVAMGIRREGIASAGFTKTLRKLGDVPVILCSGGDQDAQEVSRCAAGSNGILLANNGCMTWGSSIPEAFSMMEAVEYYGTVMAAMGSRVQTVPHQTAQRLEQRMAPAPEEHFPGLSGVTGLVRPGQRQERREVTPVIPEITSDVIHNISEKEPDQKPALQQPSVQKVTEKPKADVMAEVVRRTMQGFQL